MEMSKHYIYEIFGRKIGATNDVERRMKEQKVKEGEYRIIEEHSNAKICSLRERELQKEFGYPVDRIEYWKTLRWQKKCQTPEVRKKAVANTDYKAKVANMDYVKRTANTDYSFHKNNKFPQSCYTPEAQAKRVANTDYQAFQAQKVANTDYSYLKNHKPPQSAYTPEAQAKRASKIKKPVNQYDLQGNFIKRWDSAVDAYKELGLKSNGINHCCQGAQKTAFKFIWKYAG